MPLSSNQLAALVERARHKAPPRRQPTNAIATAIGTATPECICGASSGTAAAAV